MQHRYSTKKVYLRPIPFEVSKLQNMVSGMHKDYVQTQIEILKFLIKQHKNNEVFYKSLKIADQTIRLSQGYGLCGNLAQGLYYPNSNAPILQERVVEYLFTTWEDFSGDIDYPVIVMTKKLKADQLRMLTNHTGSKLSTEEIKFIDKKRVKATEQFDLKPKYSGSYGKQRLKLAKYMLECFEQLALVNQP